MSKSIHFLRFDLMILVANLVLALSVGARAQNAPTGKPAPPASAQAADIVRDPAEVPPPIGDRTATTVKVELIAREVVGGLDPAAGTTYRYWTFNGKVPGPMIRVRQGDQVEVTVRNDPSSHMVHSVDFHAAIGPGGGAALSQVLPGQAKTFTFEATTPGLFVYHCGTPMIADHIANGMYGLILVEPAGGLPQVDHEYYVMQGEVYTAAPKGKAGLQSFSETKLLQEAPDYFVFNGAVGALTARYPLRASTGETVRIFFGDAGPNATSSPHLVGEIFTRDYLMGSLTSPPVNGVQTGSVPPGSAAIFELKTALPGQFAFMDHAMARMAKGLMGTLDVKGAQTAQLMYAGPATVLNARQAAASPEPIAEIIGKGDGEPPTWAPAPAASVVVPSGGMGMTMEHDATASVAKPSRRIAVAQGARGKQLSGHQLDGCLTLSGASPTLRLFHSQESYKLEARPGLLSDSPLTFADNVNALVHITGNLEPAPDLDGQPWFVVDSVDQLASTCNPRESLARLRAEKARLARTSAVSASTVTVGMSDMAFLQPDIAVEVGQTVVWKNTSAIIHNVVADPAKALVASDVHLPTGAPALDSGFLQPGQSFARVFTVPGIYRYVCTLHEAGGMKGTITVRASGGPDFARAAALATR